jgi:aminopeptidase N
MKMKFCPNPILPIIVSILAILLSCKTTHHFKEKESRHYQEIDLGEIKVVANPEYKGFETKYFDLIHMKLSVIPQWGKRQLDGIAILTLTPHAYPQDTLVLDAQDFDIKSVQLVDEKGDSISNLSYFYNKRKIKIRLEKFIAGYLTNPPAVGLFRYYKSTKPYQAGDTLYIKITYTAKPEDQYKDSVITKKVEQGLYFINPIGKDSSIPTEMWSQGETEHNSCWFPTIDATDQKFTDEIDIIVDTSMVTLSNGLLKSSMTNYHGLRTDRWIMDLPHSPYLVMIAAGRYAVIHDKWRNKAVDYYVEKEYAPYARMIFGHTPAMIEYFSNLLKYDFPWQKYSQMVVRDFTSGAMENTTAVLMYEPMQHDDRSHLDYTGEETISHELFHHWFGDLVTCKSWAYLALNESFASWAESAWEEHEYGKDEADLMRKAALDAYLNEALYHKTSIIDHYYSDPEDLFDRHRYEKGALVINMLRHYLGDTVFFKGLHNYLVDNAWKNVELSDLRKAMEQASGQDLNWFFEQWFEKRGHPVLEISQEYNPEKRKLYVYVKQNQKDEKVPLFKMKARIACVYMNGQVGLGDMSRDVWLGNTVDTFIFNCFPLYVEFDPENILLCEKTEIKPLQQWEFQYHYNAGNFKSRYDAMQALSKEYKFLKKDYPGKGFTRHWNEDENISFRLHSLRDTFWYIRRQALVNLGDLDDSLFKRWYSVIGEQIERMALSDKKSMVRVAALNLLQDKRGASAMPIYKQALNDSSYQVVAIAIRNIFSNYPRQDSSTLVKSFAKYESYRSTEVKLALANVYAYYGDKDKAAYFRTLKAYGNQYYILYRKYLERMDCKFIRTQMDFIMSLDLYAKSPWELSLFRSFLYDLSANLQSRKGNEDYTTCEKLVKELQKKAQSLVIKF